MSIGMGVQETLCTRCSHREVCSLKGQFLEAVKSANDITVSCGEKSIIRLRDIPWIKPIELVCTHYREDVNERTV